MAPRAPLAVALIVAAGAIPGAPADPACDPFAALLRGEERPVPAIDADLAAVSWGTASREEIFAAWLSPPAADGHEVPEFDGSWSPPPPRGAAGLRAPPAPRSDPLLAWIPGDAAVVLFPSLPAALDAVDRLGRSLPALLPGLCGDGPWGARDALRRGMDRLLLPSAWGANPEAPTGVRSVALVVADPDLRGACEVALVAEVEDASLVLGRRRGTLSFESRGRERFRVEGLDARTDDGSVRSWFACEGGVAIWSASRDLRERVLAAGAGRAPSLCADPAASDARRAFPAAAGGALLVVPDGFVARAGSEALRLRREQSLFCAALMLDLDAWSLRETRAGANYRTVSCPSGGGAPRWRVRDAGAFCPRHGSVANPEPLGDHGDAASGRLANDATLDRARQRLARAPDAVAEGALPIAALLPSDGRGVDGMELLVPSGAPGEALLRRLAAWARAPEDDGGAGILQRLEALSSLGIDAARVPAVYASWTGRAPRIAARGLEPRALPGGRWEWSRPGAPAPAPAAAPGPAVPAPRADGGVLRLAAGGARWEWR
jgi:hypothetical protein